MPGANPLGELPLGRSVLDRAGHRRAEPDLVEKLLVDPATRVAVIVAESMEVHPTGDLVLRPPHPEDRTRLAFFLGEEPTVEPTAEPTAEPAAEPTAEPAAEPTDGPTDGDGQVAGDASERVAYVAVVGEPTLAGHGDWQTLRAAGLHLGPRDSEIFTTTQALANWHAAHDCCPRCGAPTTAEQGGWVRRCSQDGSEHYPRTDPAVIMSVLDDQDRILLGRNAQWPEGRFSVLAGFVEPGESFEAAVAREVAEEVGIEVTDVEYLGNQPWPFPSSAMIGFRARAVTTELRPDQVEMAEARWFSRDEYVKALQKNEIHTPSGISIAQRIIEHWLGRPIAEIAEVSW